MSETTTPADTDDSRECQRSDWCGPGSHCLCVPAARPAEDTGELREQIAEALHYAAEDPEDAYPVAWEDNYARNDLYDAADALLSGPLAPLLADQATVKRVEALVAFYDRHEYSALNVDDLREALAGGR